MHFFYPDNGPRSDFDPKDLAKINPNRAYMTHFNNYLFLNAILKSPQSMAERTQASKELEKCEKKMDWWSKRAGFDFDAIINEAIELKKHWKLQELVYPVARSDIAKVAVRVKPVNKGVGSY